MVLIDFGDRNIDAMNSEFKLIDEKCYKDTETIKKISILLFPQSIPYPV